MNKNSCCEVNLLVLYFRVLKVLLTNSYRKEEKTESSRLFHANHLFFFNILGTKTIGNIHVLIYYYFFFSKEVAAVTDVTWNTPANISYFPLLSREY